MRNTRHRIRYVHDTARVWEVSLGIVAITTSLLLGWFVYGVLGAPVQETWSLATVMALLVVVGSIELAWPHLAPRTMRATHPDHR